MFTMLDSPGRPEKEQSPPKTTTNRMHVQYQTDPLDEQGIPFDLEEFSAARLREIDEKSRFMFLQRFQDFICYLFTDSPKNLSRAMVALLFVAYFVYLFFAIHHSVNGAMALIVLTPLVLSIMLYVSIRDRYGGSIFDHVLKPVLTAVSIHKSLITWILYPLIAIAIVMYLVLEVYESQQQLVPFAGMTILMLIPLITSKHVTRIKFRPVIWGICLQFTMGIIVLRWRTGYLAVKFLSDQINQFLSYSLAGTAMAFGDPWFFLHPFVFLVSAMVIFVGAVTGLLMNLGIIQIIISKMAWVMRHTMGTTAIESVSIIANIFFQTLDLIQMFRSYIPKLTKSEFHTFSVGCYASIAGFAYGLFVIFGANPQHLLTAAVMSAPAAVAISKLNFPETEETYFKDENDCKIESV